jgi:hypothetical protein
MQLGFIAKLRKLWHKTPEGDQQQEEEPDDLRGRRFSMLNKTSKKESVDSARNTVKIERAARGGHVRSLSDVSFRERMESGGRLSSFGFSDVIWTKILAMLDPVSLARCSMTCLRLNRVAMVLIARMPRPDLDKAKADMEAMQRICLRSQPSTLRRMLSTEKLENKVDEKVASDWIVHPFWEHRLSRFRLIAIRRSRGSNKSDVVELRLLHGRLRYHAVLLGSKKQVLYHSEHLLKIHCLLLMQQFNSATQGL